MNIIWDRHKHTDRQKWQTYKKADSQTNLKVDVKGYKSNSKNTFKLIECMSNWMTKLHIAWINKLMIGCEDEWINKKKRMTEWINEFNEQRNELANEWLSKWIR